MRRRERRNLPAALAGLTALLLATTSCFVHRARWEEPVATSTPPADLGERLEAARVLRDSAVDREGVLEAIAAWKGLLDDAPGRPEILVELGRLELLLGAAYAEGCREREAAYRSTLRRMEAAMAARPAFRARIDRGDALWEAVDALGIEDMDAMNLWATAIFYQYRDCLSSPERVLSLRWIRRARAVMDRMQELDPDWKSGALHFAWGIYYLALPEVAGGDRARSAAELARAIELGPDWILYRWGRGRYLYLETGNPEGFREDLEWVAAQDPQKAGGHAEWNVYFQREARQLLASADELFPANDR